MKAFSSWNDLPELRRLANISSFDFEEDVRITCIRLGLDYDVVMDNLQKTKAIEDVRRILTKAVYEQYHIMHSLEVAS